MTLSKCSKLFNTETQGHVWLVTQMGMELKDVSILLYTNGNGTKGLVCLIIQMGMGPKDSFGSLYTMYIHLVVNVCLV